MNKRNELLWNKGHGVGEHSIALPLYLCVFKRLNTVVMHLHMFMVELHDLIHEGHLVRNVVIIEEVLPALSLLEISNLSWGEGGRERERDRERKQRRRGER